jgi:hypothetical protein
MLGEKRGVIYNGVLYNSTDDYPELAPLPPYPPGSGKAKDASESTPDENTPDENIPDDSTPDESTPDESTPDESTPDESTPDESTPDESTSDENMPDDSTPAENKSSGNRTAAGNRDTRDSGSMALAPNGVVLLVGLMFCMGLL